MDWKNFLYAHFAAEKSTLDQVDWDTWFNKPGLAPVKGTYDTSLQDVCTSVCYDTTKSKNIKFLKTI